MNIRVPLALPRVSPDVPRKVVFRDGGGGAARFATWLANAGVLKREHWRGNILESCEQAMRAFTDAARPNPLASMQLYVMDKPEDDLDSYISEFRTRAYQTKYKLKLPARLQSFNLVVDAAEPVHRNIGPVLRRLEAHGEGLGQTVLHAVHEGLEQCCRGLTPRNGLDWASMAYWCGEPDESYRLEEELSAALDDYEYQKKGLPKGADLEKEIGKPPTAETLDIFRRKDYDAAIPGWAGSGALHPWKLERLARYRTRDKKLRAIVAAAVAVRQEIKHRRDLNDLHCFENHCCEVVPFLLRWNGFKDPLGQIYDDVINEEFQSGDRNLHTNAAFAFHDEPSFARALRNLRAYLQLMQCCENLIRLTSLPL